jgi:hypothetical protein
LYSKSATWDGDPSIEPGPDQSIVFATHEDYWITLNPRTQQAILRYRAVLIVHEQPYRDGNKNSYNFDENSLAALTHPHCLAQVQGQGLTISVNTLLTVSVDGGARKKDGPAVHRVGRPTDLLVCAGHQPHSYLNPDQGQWLNLLANTLPNTSLPPPISWEQVIFPN